MKLVDSAMRMRTPCVVALLLAASGCGPSAPAVPSIPDAEFVKRFHAGVVELEQHRFLDASKTFRALTVARPNNVGAWINLAEAELNRNTPETYPALEAAIAGALKADPKNAHAHFIRGVLHKHLGEFEAAEARFRAAMETAPEDPSLLYQLATVLPEERAAEAIAYLEKCLEGQAHLSSAYYQLAGIKGRTDREARMALLAAFKTFDDAETGNKAGIVYTEMGRLGEAWRDAGVLLPPPPATGAAAFVPGAVLASHAAALATAAAAAAPIEIMTGPPSVYADFDQDGVVDVAELADGALSIRSGKGAGAASFADVAAFTVSDVDQDSDLDVVFVRKDGAVGVALNLRDAAFGFALYDPASWLGGRIKAELPKLPAAAVAVAASDLDGDGDPDLLFAGSFGIRLWRNDRLMRFVDATTRAGLDRVPSARAFLSEDLDADRAPDLIVLGADGAPHVFKQVVRGAFTLTFAPVKGSLEAFAPIRAIRLADFDLDGFDDLVVATDASLFVASRGGERVAAGLPLDLRTTIDSPPAVGLLVGDLNGDLVPDVVANLADGSARTFLAAKPPGRHALGVRLQGKVEPMKMRANTNGIGARVEAVAGGRAVSREVRANDGMPGSGPHALSFGLGAAGQADYVRINWPDDVLQIEGPVPGGQMKVVEENQRKASSCPLVFVWNGERYEFVTDFLGVGGLGFLLEPGVYAPPDPTELVLLPTIVPRDGTLDLVIHEPFEEVCYLDVARLIVVDHDADVEILPDERFAVQAEAPDGRIFAVRDRMLPVSATDGRGRDASDAVRAVDRVFASAVPDPQFLGWAEPTTFTFDFGAPLAAAAGAEGFVLALDGWVEYPYSHIVLAASQRGLRLEPLSVDVEVEGTGFVSIAPEAAYPAGMPRTMTLPLPALPKGLTGKLRLRTNQELHVDRLSLFKPSDAPIEKRTLDATYASLRATGFPREYSPDGRLPRLYDYDVMDKTMQFKTLAGAFTRFGDVRELLTRADDRYVTFAGGEEIALRFPAPPPPAPGRKRTFILDTVGWCKDMDPHTAAPYTLEPLPFLKMSGYPYPPSESFPDTPAHRSWRKEYQTRFLPGTRAGR